MWSALLVTMLSLWVFMSARYVDVFPNFETAKEILLRKNIFSYEQYWDEDGDLVVNYLLANDVDSPNRIVYVGGEVDFEAQVDYALRHDASKSEISSVHETLERYFPLGAQYNVHTLSRAIRNTCDVKMDIYYTTVLDRFDKSVLGSYPSSYGTPYSLITRILKESK